MGEPVLAAALTGMAAAPSRDQFIVAAGVFEAGISEAASQFGAADVSAARCRFYAAVSGHRDSAKKVAAHAVSLAYAPISAAGSARAQVAGAVAWLLAATGQQPLPNGWSRTSATLFLSVIDDSSGPGPKLLQRMLRGQRKLLAEPARLERRPATSGTSGASRRSPSDSAGGSPVPALGACLNPTRIIVSQIGNPGTTEGARVASELGALIGRPLPLAAMPDPAALRRVLLGEFPHAAAVTGLVLDGLASPAHVALPPIALVGPHGCGKTTFAVRLAELLGLPWEIYPCGGVNDAAFGGTTRRWAAAEPSVPLSLVRALHHASPAIVLDELDKAAASRVNGSLADALLGLLDPQLAARWRDPYVEAPVDLSGVIWLTTLNDVGALPGALRDRFLIVTFPVTWPGAPSLPRPAASPAARAAAWARPAVGRAASRRGARSARQALARWLHPAPRAPARQPGAIAIGCAKVRRSSGK
jgi:ATPase family associated with various cellular activities (AAA)